jgi:hypothetical protein
MPLRQATRCLNRLRNVSCVRRPRSFQGLWSHGGWAGPDIHLLQWVVYCCKDNHTTNITLCTCNVERTVNKSDNLMPCHGSGGQSPASHGGGPGSRPAQSMRDLRRIKWHWNGFFSGVFGFPCQYHSTVTLYTHITCGKWTTGLLVAAVQRHALTLWTWTTTRTDNQTRSISVSRLMQGRCNLITGWLIVVAGDFPSTTPVAAVSLLLLAPVQGGGSVRARTVSTGAYRPVVWVLGIVTPPASQIAMQVRIIEWTHGLYVRQPDSPSGIMKLRKFCRMIL